MISNQEKEKNIGFYFVACYGAQGEMTQQWSDNVCFIPFCFDAAITLPKAVDLLLG